MKKYIIFASVFAVSALCGCDGGKSFSSAYRPEPLPPAVEDNVEPDADVAGVLNLSSGRVSVPAYSGDGYYTLLYCVPEIAADGITKGVSYEISASGRPFSGLGPAAAKRAAEFYGRVNADAHSFLRETENALLSSGAYQAAPDLKKGPAGVSVGDRWRGIYISRNASGNETVIDASCIFVSERAYFFLEDGLNVPDEALLKAYGDGFDTIHSIMREKFGAENDVDGNGKVIILFFKASDRNLYGYFSAKDKYPSDVYGTSNSADMFYVNFDAVSSDMNDVLATLAHEFQHMILFDNRYNEGFENLDIWINEGLSMQAEYYTGYWDKQSGDYVGAFLRYYPRLNLTYWDYDSFLNYGYSMVYIRYLAERFGDGIVERLYKTPYTGVYAVEDSAGMGFNDIFKDFVLALFISGRGISDDAAYNFKTLDIPSYGGLEVTYSASAGEAARSYILPYGMRLFYFSGSVTDISLNGAVKGYGASGVLFGDMR